MVADLISNFTRGYLRAEFWYEALRGLYLTTCCQKQKVSVLSSAAIRGSASLIEHETAPIRRAGLRARQIRTIVIPRNMVGTETDLTLFQ